ncbi:T9SS type A sorting domain-containing protein [uncultured Kordia sp.]|uniref:T9SS type A sorting domain-containing protein n=1 Tax=uncultured Kordia sp. TaxID=507699 RepID=UPI00261024D0|nr:T9SS type A sorting domain-containing protein [uncultured Kordia sp.]
MKKLLLTIAFCMCIFGVSAQCNINPFIQQNYEFDAKLLVLREIQNNPSDPDYDNPILSQSRVNDYLEELSAIYTNPQNTIEIDSLFNEFQFHVSPKSLQYKDILFHVDTNASWVQSLKDNGTTGIAAFDNILSTYQFSVFSATDYTTPPFENKTSFRLTTTQDFLNTYALRDDLQNATTEDLFFALVFFNDPLCQYNGIPYMIETYELPPQEVAVVDCDITKNVNTGRWTFRLFGGCIPPDPSQDRFVNVSDDCSTVNFSRTLSTIENELTNVSIYPNPTSDKLNIQGITNLKRVELYSMLGTQIKADFNNTTVVDVSNLKIGVYFLKVIDDQNRSIVKKFVKK